MRYIGIDMAKDEFQFCIPNEVNTKLENNRKGFQKLLKHLESGDILGVESTSKLSPSTSSILFKKRI